MMLGIDFGTTRTVVASAIDGRYPVAAYDVDGVYREYIPGLAVQRGRELSFGWQAVQRMHESPDGSIRSIKRLVGGMPLEEPVPGFADQVTGIELVTGFLRHLRQQLAKSSNLDVPRRGKLDAAVAVPANASTRQRFLTLEAFARSGFRVHRMVSEPTAAAVELAHHQRGMVSARSPKRYVVVYDLGGGTFDVSAVSLEGRSFELISTEGISALGGDDFDQVILDLALEPTGRSADSLSPTRRVAALETCREAKEGVRANSRKLLVDLGEDQPVVLDLATVYERSAPLVERTVELVDRVLASLAERGLDPDNPRQLGALYLVGGAAAFPPVARILRARYGRKLRLAPQPTAATAIGLAVCGDADADVLVREATTRHFGVWRESDAGRNKVFDPILNKDTLPQEDRLVVTRTYRPVHRVGHLRFLECTTLNEGGQPAGDVTPWREIRFPYTTDARGELASSDGSSSDPTGEEIAETYVYDAHGRVSVEIANRTRGYERRYSLGTLR